MQDESFLVHPQPPLLHFAFIERLICLQSFSNPKGERWEWCNFSRESVEWKFSRVASASEARFICEKFRARGGRRHGGLCTWGSHPKVDSQSQPCTSTPSEFSAERFLSRAQNFFFFFPPTQPKRIFFPLSHEKQRLSGESQWIVFHVASKWDLQYLDKKQFFVVAVEQKHWELYRSVQFL